MAKRKTLPKALAMSRQMAGGGSKRKGSRKNPTLKAEGRPKIKPGKKKSYTIALRDSKPETVNGIAYGVFAVRKVRPGEYKLDHMASGYGLFTYSTKRVASEVAQELSKHVKASVPLASIGSTIQNVHAGDLLKWARHKTNFAFISYADFRKKD